MNVLILGHLVLDEIHTFGGERIESAGGITFPLSAFGAAADKDDQLFPMFPYGDDAAYILDELSEAFPTIDRRYCTRVSEANTRVRLFHDANASYNTQLVSSLGSISRDDLLRALPSANLIYLNMMTGHDLLVEDARLLRGSGRLVYLDLHMIAYRVRNDGHRETAPPDNWIAWARSADVLHCNEREFSAFVGSGLNEQEKLSALFEAAPQLRFVVITRGSEGADIFAAEHAPVHVPAWSVEKIIDTTGCGDTFGSVFALGLARGEEVGTAAQRAAKAAAFVATLPGSNGMTGLRGVLSEARR